MAEDAGASGPATGGARGASPWLSGRMKPFGVITINPNTPLYKDASGFFWQERRLV